MQKSTFWAITSFMVMGIILSFTSMGIFLVKYDQDKQVLIKQQSTLTEYEYLQFSANALDWGATPGYKNVTQYNEFKLFSYVDGTAFEEGNEAIKYSYVSEISNRTYVPSSPGYIKFLPSFKFQKLSDNGINVTNLNIAAIQYFYKSYYQPAFVKLPRYLTMLFRGLSEDLINYYFTHTIYEFYTNDQQSVYDTIFKPAKIITETQEKLWNDELYGWKSEKTFRKWVTAHFNGGDYKLQQYFQLTDEQMKGLIGNGSIIDKLRKLIINSVSTGVAGRNGSCANPNKCTYWELGVVQWAVGGLTAKDFVPPVQFGGGSYSTFNDSIPEVHEFYKTGHELQLSEVITLISEVFEQSPNLLNFETMQYIWNNRDSNKRICNKLGWQVNNNETLAKAEYLVDYLKFQYNYVNTIEDTYAFQTWRFMSKMINEAGYMLRDGLHAKAIFYAFKAVNCKDSFLIPFDNVCDSKYDFTIAPENALPWVNAALERKDSESFKKLAVAISANAEVLSDYLYGGLSQFSKQLNSIKDIIAKYYTCQYSPCQAEELWYKQWGSSSVTQNYPIELQFSKEDKVVSISEWDIYSSRNFVYYEFFSFSKIKVSENIQKQLFQYDMGGIFGYYSLRNLFEHHFNETIPSNDKFPIKGDDLELLIGYIKHCLTNYWYGGQIITTEGSKYLFDYDNTYTDDLSNFEPIYEGAFWRDNGAHLIEPNNNEFKKSATMYDFYQMDTGIKNIDNVGTMIKTLDESKLRQKFIIYYNEATEILTTYYKYPYGSNAVVDGSYGYAFKPNLVDEFEQKLQLFDFEISKNVTLKYHTQSKHHDFNVYEYRLEDTLISLEQAREIPVYITIGNQNLEGCATINKKSCSEFMAQLPLSTYKIEEVTGTVVQFSKTYVYWLKLDQTNPLRQGELFQEMYVPLATRTVSYEYNKDQMQQHFSKVQDLQSTKKTLFIITLLFGILFVVGFIGVIVFFRKNEQNIISRPASVYSVIEAD